ncbi:MAG: hypothetical protein ACI4I9_06505 [Porcipelethomonas sp.]
MQSSVYIIVMQTGTGVAKIFKALARKPYNHVSISCDPNLSEMYSFCRNNPRFPLPASFNREIVGQGTLGKFSNIPCEIYRLPVSAHQKDLINENLEHFRNNRDDYSYNCLGLGLIFFHIAYKRKKKFVCSQFVSHVLEQSEVELGFKKPSSLLIPEDFRHIDESELIYRGELNEFWRTRNLTANPFEVPAEQPVQSA